MFLTEAWLDADTAVRRHLHDSYRWHRAVWEAFPGHESDPRQFLTRLDSIRDRFRLYIVSDWEPQRPAWWPEGESHWRTRQIHKSFFFHKQYGFQLCANPTRKVVKLDPSGKPTKNGRREPLRTREELAQWIVRKGQQGGFSPALDTLRIVPLGRRWFQRKGGDGTHSAVDYKGVLEVCDPQKFIDAFRRGIGPAKGFGFGLLLLAPLPEAR